LLVLVIVMTCSALACAGGNDTSGAGGGDTSGGGGVGSGGDGAGGGCPSCTGAGGAAGSAGQGGAGGATGGVGGGVADAGTDGDDAAIETGPPTTLKAGAAQTGRLFGAALGAAHLSEAAYATTAAAELNFATPENEMKWDATEPSRNVFTFSAGDAIVAFAAQNGIKVKGHTLVWHSQLPTWVSGITDPTDLHNAMINHITNVVTHFRGQVIAWDVVNEAWGDNGQMRNSIFYQYLGAGFIDDAFNAAHAADPAARLYYNEYGAEGLGTKSDLVYSMVHGMMSRGIPINGVGLQMHTGPADASPTAADVASNMQRLAALGLEVLISEMDVQICTSDLVTQSTRYHDIVADCVAQPACTAVTVWGVPDKYSWRNGQSCATPRPLLFDDSYLPKPAHAGVMDALLGR
jgi:endo-1,4-beta-xylanase